MNHDYAGIFASPFQPSNYGNGQQANTNFWAFESTQGYGLRASSSVPYESDSLSFQGVNAGFGSASVSEYENYNTSIGNISSNDNDWTNAIFNAADLNKDGKIDLDEFRQFLISQFQHQ